MLKENQAIYHSSLVGQDMLECHLQNEDVPHMVITEGKIAFVFY